MICDKCGEIIVMHALGKSHNSVCKYFYKINAPPPWRRDGELLFLLLHCDARALVVRHFGEWSATAFPYCFCLQFEAATAITVGDCLRSNGDVDDE